MNAVVAKINKAGRDSHAHWTCITVVLDQIVPVMLIWEDADEGERIAWDKEDARLVKRESRLWDGDEKNEV